MPRQDFGLLDGRTVEDIALENAGGASARILTYGASLRDLVVPLEGGGTQRVVLGFGDFESYLEHPRHFGAVAGRYANRIAGGRFVLDGKAHQLPLNLNDRHTLHGGPAGLGRVNWTVLDHDPASVTLGHVSPDGEQGFPGTLTLTCRYRLLDPAVLRVELAAFTDQATVVNLAHHAYFNLDGSDDILDHELMMRAHVMTPVDAEGIPDGSMQPVSGTPYDFRRPRPVRMADAEGRRIAYDNNFMLRRERREPGGAGVELAHAATLASAKNRLSMEVWTTEPCLQFYDGGKLAIRAPVGHDGRACGPAAGLCLEAQHAPDSPNNPHFPTTVLRPGELYRQVTEYRFGAMGETSPRDTGFGGR